MITFRAPNGEPENSYILTFDIELADTGLLRLVGVTRLLRPVVKRNTLLVGDMVVVWRHSYTLDILSIPLRLVWMSLDGPGHLDDLPGYITQYVLPHAGAHT